MQTLDGSSPTADRLPLLQLDDDSASVAEQVVGQLRSMMERPGTWAPLFTADFISLADAVLGMLSRSLDGFQMGREQALLAAPLSELRIQKVQASIERGFERTATLRQIMGAMPSGEPENGSTRYVRRIRLEPKRIYVEDSVPIEGWGENLGEEVASEENTLLVGDLASSLKKDAAGPLSAARALLEAGYKPTLFVPQNLVTLAFVRSLPGFQHDWNRPDVYGTLDCGVEVRLLRQLPPRTLLVADLKALGRVGQHSILEGLDRHLPGSGLGFSVSTTDENEARARAEADSSRRVRSDGSPMSVGEAAALLRTNVEVQLGEAISLVLLDPSAAVIVTVEAPNEADPAAE
jgi:hypothetical protein